jgi:glycerol kinase
MLPALAGLGAPWWRPEARAVIAGLTGRTRSGHLARAALEAIAWRVADIVAAVSEHTNPEVLRVDGGLSRIDLLVQLQADCTGLPIERGTIDATAAGAAALAAVGAGVWDGTREIAERVPTGDRTEARRDERWRRGQRDAWLAFVDRVAGL